ncbi:UbiX family flavin prenyltransferase [Halosquirtibacter laminarini]|uniref:UbiX family flavin prenyltransferase n=1 Tax=Halosquirtibacter laminarini TaxID=3374600 RepID=A0AC61NK48_9BACT|nr:UbiX family flavin prenyltransferase [Prolixibacteraceae bacterium]
MKIVVAITGATGAPLAYKVLSLLKEQRVEVHLIISDWAEKTISIESDKSVADFKALSDVVYTYDNMAASISSGSFLVDAMIIVPCSMKTLASISHGLADNLISRAADVMIKEGRDLVLSVRETPLSAIHLRNMLSLAELGVKICPPMPAFYNQPQNIDDILTHSAVKILDLLKIYSPKAKRWGTRS